MAGFGLLVSILVERLYWVVEMALKGCRGEVASLGWGLIMTGGSETGLALSELSGALLGECGVVYETEERWPVGGFVRK